LGHLKFAIEVGRKGDQKGGIFDALQDVFNAAEFGSLLAVLNPVYTFRNKFVAHQEKEESIGRDTAHAQLKDWIKVLVALYRCRSLN